eukprot:3040251-Rhodomonas_salina.1
MATKRAALPDAPSVVQVPALTIFNVGLRPVIIAKVRKLDDGVMIEAKESKIEQIGELDLAKGFDINTMTSSAIKVWLPEASPLYDAVLLLSPALRRYQVVLKRLEDRRGLRHQLQARCTVSAMHTPSAAQIKPLLATLITILLPSSGPRADLLRYGSARRSTCGLTHPR